MPADPLDSHRRLELAVLRLEAQAARLTGRVLDDLVDDDDDDSEWEEFLDDHPELTEEPGDDA